MVVGTRVGSDDGKGVGKAVGVVSLLGFAIRMNKKSSARTFGTTTPKARRKDARVSSLTCSSLALTPESVNEPSATAMILNSGVGICVGAGVGMPDGAAVGVADGAGVAVGPGVGGEVGSWSIMGMPAACRKKR